MHAHTHTHACARAHAPAPARSLQNVLDCLDVQQRLVLALTLLRAEREQVLLLSPPLSIAVSLLPLPLMATCAARRGAAQPRLHVLARGSRISCARAAYRPRGPAP